MFSTRLAMSYKKKLQLPPTGEVSDYARLVSWHVQPNDKFVTDDLLYEIETDKSIIEIVAEEDGTVLELLVKEDDQITPTTDLLIIDSLIPPVKNNDASEAKEEDEEVKAAPIASKSVEPVDSASTVSTAAVSHEGRILSTPAARYYAKKHAIDISSIQPKRSRVTLKDILAQTSQSQDKSVSYPYVFIHGMYSDEFSWDPVINQLQKSNAVTSTITLLGHAQQPSTKIEVIDDIVSHAIKDIVAKHDSEMILVGHSLGALIAAKIASTGKVPIKHLVLIAPAGLGTRINQDFLDGMLYSNTIESVSRELGKTSFSEMPLSDTYVESLIQKSQINFDNLTTIKKLISNEGIQQVSITNDLKLLDIPITIIHGKEDTIVSSKDSLNSPDLTRLYFLSETGHIPQLEQPKSICTILRQL